MRSLGKSKVLREQIETALNRGDTVLIMRRGRVEVRKRRRHLTLIKTVPKSAYP